MAWTIKPKHRTADATAPTTANLADGEFAINSFSRKLYIRVGAAIVELYNAVTKADVGLSNVDNTFDAAKPVSSAQQTALNLKADTSHKYHQFSIGQYFYDNYEQGRYFRLFTQSASSDLVRWAPITDVEYWDGAAWVAWVGGAAVLQPMLDGREETSAVIDHTHRKFRFTVTKITGWPTTTILVVQSTWCGISYPGMTVTTENRVSSVWTVKDTAVMSSANTGGDFGMHAKVVNSIHDGQTQSRITVDINDWVDNGSYVTIPIRRFMMLSNYMAADLMPMSWNYSKVVDFKAVPTVLGSAVWTATTLPAATGSVNGYMTATDKAKLDGVAAGAQVNAVTSVATRTGAVVLSKADVGLSNVDDTTDTAKPVSTAQQAALNLKLNTDEASEGNVGSKLMRRNVNGDVFARLYRSEFIEEASISGAIAYRVAAGTDNYIRFCNNPANIRTFLGLGTAATYSVGTTGTAVALTNGANQWSAVNNFAGITFTQTIASGPTDLSKQIQLWAGYGFSITSNALNMVSGGTTLGFYTSSGFALSLIGLDATFSGSLNVPNSTVSDVAGNVRDIPQRLSNAHTTLALSDAGKHIYSGNSTAYTWTVPTNAAVAFPVGTVVTFVAGSGGAKTIAGSAGVTLIGIDGTVGNVTLSSTRRMATILKVSADVWMIS